MSPKVFLLKGDITTLKVDCIVNSANKSLLAGSGVSGAIHRKAGKELEKECKSMGFCDVGEAVITKGYGLPVKHLIHTVGPVFGKESGKEAALLSKCYRSSLKLAEKHHLSSIAFPSISTGHHNFPNKIAAKVVAQVLLDCLKKSNRSIKEIFMVAYSQDDFSIYERAFKQMGLLGD
ncbi:macro domain-containing protein [Patescibacteria group bacterium]|nr:macro domain-containing protein [Patescibacteria group bacterium]